MQNTTVMTEGDFSRLQLSKSACLIKVPGSVLGLKLTGPSGCEFDLEIIAGKMFGPGTQLYGSGWVQIITICVFIPCCDNLI